MRSWALLFGALVAPLGRKLLAALGFGTITLVGLSALQGRITSAVADMWGGLAPEVLQIMTLAGAVTAVNIWLAAIVTVVALLAFKRLGILTA